MRSKICQLNLRKNNKSIRQGGRPKFMVNVSTEQKIPALYSKLKGIFITSMV